MTHHIRTYLMCAVIFFGLMTRDIQAGGDTGTSVQSSVIIILCALCSGMGYYIYTYIKGHEGVSVKITKVDRDLGLFKDETHKNFHQVLTRQELLAQGQSSLVEGQATLVDGQQKLQAQVVEVDAKVTAAQKGIEGVTAVAHDIQKDTTDIRKCVIELDEKIKNIQDQLKRQAEQMARVESDMARRCDIANMRLNLSKMDGNIENLAKIVVTKGDIPGIRTDFGKIVKNAVHEEFERTKAEYGDHSKQLRAPYESEPGLLALPASRMTIKQVA